MTGSSTRHRKLQLAFRAALGVLGVTAIVWLVREIGADKVGEGLRRAAPWLPLALALEGGRLASETVATRLLLGTTALRVPWGPFIRAHLAAYSVNMTMPAGRVGAEALKATLLAPFVGVGRAAVVAVMNQSLTMISIGVISIPCVLASWLLTGSSVLTLTIGVHGLVVLTFGLLVLAAARGRHIADALKSFRKLREGTAKFRAEIQELPVLPLAPALWFVGGHVLQAAQFTVLFVALGIPFGVLPTFLAEGVNLIGAAAGDVVPAQLGTIDGAFAYAATALGTTQAQAVVIAVLVHIVQLTWVAVGAVVAAVWQMPLPRGDEEVPVPDTHESQPLNQDGARS